MRIHKVIAATVAVLAGASLGACGATNGTASQTASGMSRVTIYRSVDQLMDDSDAVIVGDVQSTTTTRDIDDATDFTLASVLVKYVAKGDLAPSDGITVRQTGTDAPQLSEGDTVLLFLVRSGLDGDLAEHYYITGATAGMYEADPLAKVLQTDESEDDGIASDTQFERIDKDSGDDLPMTLTMDDIR